MGRTFQIRILIVLIMALISWSALAQDLTSKNALSSSASTLSVSADGQISLDNDSNKLNTQHLSQPPIQPVIAYLLLVIGIYGIFFEAINPGLAIPGIIGALALLLSIYSFQFLPVNYLGFVLIILGIAGILGEFVVRRIYILGLTGTIAFIWGSVLLMDGGQSPYPIPWQIILAMVFTNLIFIFILGRIFLSTRKQKIMHGTAMLIGMEGRTLGRIDLKGQAVIRGEIWNVHAKIPIEKNRTIKVIAVKGLDLEVKELS